MTKLEDFVDKNGLLPSGLTPEQANAEINHVRELSSKSYDSLPSAQQVSLDLLDRNSSSMSDAGWKGSTYRNR